MTKKEMLGLVCFIASMIIFSIVVAYYQIKTLKEQAKGKDCVEKMHEICPDCKVDYHAYSNGTVLLSNECECCGTIMTNTRYCIKKRRTGEFLIEQKQLK